MYLELLRTVQTVHQTTGNLFVMNEKHLALNVFTTLELPWLDNKRQVSCIPQGVYTVRRRWSIKYGNHLHLIDVSGRDLILIHTGNFFFQTLGCILIGKTLSDINHDGIVDIVSSKSAMKQLLTVLPKGDITLNIINAFDIDIV